MPSLNVTAEAEADIDSIVEYTRITWGWRQADRYLTKLEDGFDLLTRNPSLGRSCDAIQPGLRRFEIGSHVMFYRSEPGGLRVLRVLHQQMVPVKSRFES